MHRIAFTPLLLLLLAAPLWTHAQDEPFSRMDVFDLQWVEDPQISPDGERIVYVRRAMDIMEDRRTSSLWMMNADGSGHARLTNRDADESNPRWSPDGSRIAFTSSDDSHGSQIHVYWVEGGTTARITDVERSPSGLSWSPDGEHIAFSSHVPEPAPTLVAPPEKPDGADWKESPRIETRINHELDGTGLLEYGYAHLFVVSAEGGAVRQVTSGEYHHNGRPEWTPDGEHLIFSANRNDEWEYEFRNAELYSVRIDGGEITQLTDRFGPNHSPVASPDGEQIAYLGYEDQIQTFQNTRLYVMNSDGSNDREIDTGLDRSFDHVIWDEDGQGLYIMYVDRGSTTLAHTTLDGEVTEVARGLGGSTIGRPYGGGAAFTISDDGVIAFNHTTPEYPAELAVTQRGQGNFDKITDLNGDLLSRRQLGEVEEIWYTSSEDGRDLHGWVITPPGYDADREYPLLVELHGGPINNYGDRFTPTLQLYAAAGYVVFYPNFRGSTGYGEEFGDLLYHDFSGGEYQDIMDGVDVLIEDGVVSGDSLYVTGGSAGGTSTAWIVGMNNRFNAAVVQKPVINWISKTLAADNHYAYADYRYPGQPWENPMDYWEVSPISLVGNVETPTMLLVGSDDLRTPTWEALQFYHALRLRGIDTMYVELHGSPHNLTVHPTHLIQKVDHVLAWFERYR